MTSSISTGIKAGTVIQYPNLFSPWGTKIPAMQSRFLPAILLLIGVLASIAGCGRHEARECP